MERGWQRVRCRMKQRDQVNLTDIQRMAAELKQRFKALKRYETIQVRTFDRITAEPQWVRSFRFLLSKLKQEVEVVDFLLQVCDWLLLDAFFVTYHLRVYLCSFHVVEHFDVDAVQSLSGWGVNSVGAEPRPESVPSALETAAFNLR